ncbi:MAG: SDR family NAD(P)-dependent oxidoreductase [Bacteroidetes bacterium]|jgi:short-subunit dehydrogenase|nr:SDR family NAD(P)-dependent oxidoreductase [Bacteroidota bacterium]
MDTYKHKTILLTGASSGIGAAMARQLADPTVTLLLTARSADALHTLADALRAHGTSVAVFPHDLSTPGAAADLHEQVTAAGHTVDVLINNAGFGKQGRFEEYDAATYAQMLTLNVTNLVSLTHHCLPAMLERGAGGILNVASTAAFQAVPFFAVYSASKSFVLHFSEALHSEYADRGVTVTCLCPGNTESNFHERAESNHEPPAFLVESAEQVAQVGLRALLDGAMTKVSGGGNAVMAAASRLLPRAAVVAATRQMFAP